MIDDHWKQFCATLEAIGAELLPAAPDDAARAEGVAYLARLAAYGVERYLMGPDRLQNGLSFSVPRIGGYNPDYRIGSANLRSGGRYRLTGNLRGAYRVGVGAYSLQSDGRIAIDSYRVLNAPGMVAGDGNFDLKIEAGVNPEIGLALTPTSNLLLIRELRLKTSDAPAEFAFTADDPIATAAPSAGDIERSLQMARHFITGSLKQFMLWGRTFAERPNEMTPLAPELDKAVQGDPGTRYFSGYFHLRDDQALVIEIPHFNCDYWNVQVINHWLEPLPASHRNHATAQPDSDRVTRIVVASRDPGHANWLPTGGRERGALFHRTINADRALTPRCYLRG